MGTGAGQEGAPGGAMGTGPSECPEWPATGPETLATTTPGHEWPPVSMGAGGPVEREARRCAWASKDREWEACKGVVATAVPPLPAPAPTPVTSPTRDNLPARTAAASMSAKKVSKPAAPRGVKVSRGDSGARPTEGRGGVGLEPTSPPSPSCDRRPENTGWGGGATAPLPPTLAAALTLCRDKGALGGGGGGGGAEPEPAGGFEVGGGGALDPGEGASDMPNKRRPTPALSGSAANGFPGVGDPLPAPAPVPVPVPVPVPTPRVPPGPDLEEALPLPGSTLNTSRGAGDAEADNALGAMGPAITTGIFSSFRRRCGRVAGSKAGPKPIGERDPPSPPVNKPSPPSNRDAGVTSPAARKWASRAALRRCSATSRSSNSDTLLRMAAARR
jgi:hypothetical protein